MVLTAAAGTDLPFDFLLWTDVRNSDCIQRLSGKQRNLGKQLGWVQTFYSVFKIPEFLVDDSQYIVHYPVFSGNISLCRDFCIAFKRDPQDKCEENSPDDYLYASLFVGSGGLFSGNIIPGSYYRTD